MTCSGLEREIRKKTNCTIYREGSKHTKWINPDTKRIFTIPRHKTQDIKSGTLKSIREAVGLE